MGLNRSGGSLCVTERGAFSGWPAVVGWLAMSIFACRVCTHMVAAGDIWIAMACGRHFANHGVEPFSANSHSVGPTEEETWPGCQAENR